MAALVAPRGTGRATFDAALVAAEPYVTKPDVRRRVTDEAPTGVGAEGSCVIPMLLPDIDHCS